MHYNKLIAILYSFVVFIIFVAVVTSSVPIKAKYSDDCLVCHEDKDLTMDKNGKKISLYINPSVFKASVHGGADCKDCHVGYNPEELPHNPKSSGVNCNECHDIKKNPSAVHNNVKCYSCHGDHNVIPAKEFAKSDNCFTCHNTKSVSSYKQSVHFRRNISCDKCHKSGHDVIKISKQESTRLCAQCHSKAFSEVSNSVHKQTTGRGKTPICVDCHGYHSINANKLTIESQSCYRCHLNEKMFPGKEKGSADFVAEYEKSVHNSVRKNGIPAASCTDCHGDHLIKGSKDLQTKDGILESCMRCHEKAVNEFKMSKHGNNIEKSPGNPFECTDCHGEHGILAVKLDSKLSKLMQTDMCLECHKDSKFQSKYKPGTELHINEYLNSAHYKKLKEGNPNAASCTDCHGSHSMLNALDPNSPVSPKNISATCGQSNCHIKIYNEYKGSIHDVSIQTKEKSDAPSCVNCHGSHGLLKNDDQSNPLAKPKGVVQLCADCHASVRIVENNNLPKGIVSDFNNSFHGLALRGGSQEAADCGSCHGVHNIRPSSDPQSTIHDDNLPQTCGSCHPGATLATFKTPIHLVDTAKENPLLKWVEIFYIFLIIATIGFMVLHNILDLIKKLRTKH